MDAESQEKSPVETGLDSIAQTTGGFQTKPVGRRGGRRNKIKNLDFCKAVLTLTIKNGFNARQVARLLKTSEHTISYILDSARIDELRQQVVAKMARDMVAVQEMVFAETIDKKDRRLGKEMLTDSGWLGELRDKTATQPGERGITFEFNFPPPPWAPHAIAHAPQTPQPTRLVDKVDENKPKLRPKPAPVDVPPRD